MAKRMKFLTLILSLLMIFSNIQFVSAADDDMQIVLEDVTGSTDTLKGEAKVKVSVKGLSGNLTVAQLSFNFSDNAAFSSVSYSKAIKELEQESKSDSKGTFFIQPIDAKTANTSKEFFVAFSGGRNYPLGVDATGTEICVVTLKGEPEEDITFSLTDLENSYSVSSPNLISPKNNVSAPVSITVKASNTDNQGCNLTVHVKLDELKESGGFSDASDITLKLTNLDNGSTQSYKLSDANKTDVVTYTYQIENILAGKYDMELSAIGFVSAKLKDVSINSNKTINVTSDDFYAGDVNSDSKLTVRDYNRIVSMYADKASAYSAIDYNRDNKFDHYDILAMINSSINHIESDAKGSVPAALKVVSSKSDIKVGDTFTITLSLDAGNAAVKSYFIKGTYPKDIAALEKAECVETSAVNKAINEIGNGEFRLLNTVSNGSNDEIYKLTFKAKKAGRFSLSFDTVEGGLPYDIDEAADNLLNITLENATVKVTSSDTSGSGGGGGGGGGGFGGGTSAGTDSSPAAAEHNAYVTGYEDGTIRPDNDITRAEAVAMLSRVSSDFDSTKTYDVSAFSDISADDWFAANVGYAVSAGIVKGYEDGTFKSNAKITREEFATMVCRYMGYVLDSTESFVDVPDDHWAKTYIDTMKKNGIITGYGDGSFGIGRAIVRAEVITIINRALGRTPSDAKADDYVSQNGYPASDIEGHWACNQMIEACMTHNKNILH